MKFIYLVYGIAYEETDIDKAFIRKAMAELYAEKMNVTTDDYYWYKVEEIELVE